MKTRVIGISVLSCILFLSLGMTWYFSREISLLQNAAQVLTTSVNRLSEQRALLDTRLAEMSKRRIKIGNRSPGPPPATRPAETKSENVTRHQLQSSDPQAQNRMLAYERSGVVMEYQALMKELNLTPQQAAQFEENLSTYRANTLDLRTVVAIKGLPSDDPAVSKLRLQHWQDYSAAQQELLGEKGLQSLQSYDRVKTARELVRNLAGAATIENLTLSREQMTQLTESITTASRLSQSKNTGSILGIDWEAIDRQTRTFLSAEQHDFISKAEIFGPFGSGTRFQNRFHELVSRAALADRDAKKIGK